MNIDYKIIEVKPNVFAVMIPNQYDRAMLFCRAQEYYESPNKKFRGKDFSIWDYMKWYASNHTGFSYAGDWSGFNIPFDIMWECYNTLSNLPDWETPYDGYMWEILVAISNKMDVTKKAYVIGAGDMEGDTFQHEVAHGLYYTNKEYKQLMDEITETIEWQDYLKFEKNLLDMGYTAAVIPDEIQAYLAFGHDYKPFTKGVDKRICKDLNKEYIKVFGNF